MYFIMDADGIIDRALTLADARHKLDVAVQGGFTGVYIAREAKS